MLLSIRNFAGIINSLDQMAKNVVNLQSHSTLHLYVASFPLTSFVYSKTLLQRTTRPVWLVRPPQITCLLQNELIFTLL